MEELSLKRVYEPRAEGDGQRVLVDRIWPRGLNRADLADVIWLKEIGPSTELRNWFGHSPQRWWQFRQRYWAELDLNPMVVVELHSLPKKGHLTLLYSARDTRHNQAVALANYLQSR